MKNKTIGTLHIGLLLGLLGSGPFISNGLLSMNTPTLLTILTLVSCLLALRYECIRFLPHPLKPSYVTFTAIWFIMTVLSTDNLGFDQWAWVTLFLSSVFLLLYTLHFSIQSEPAHRLLGLSGLLALVYFFTFIQEGTYGGSNHENQASIAITLGLTLIACAHFIYIFKDLPLPSKKWKLFFSVLIMSPFVLSTIVLARLTHEPILAFISNLVLFSAAVGFMLYGSQTVSSKHVNLGLCVLLILLITRFIDYFGSMLDSGIGYIVLGLVLGLIAYGVHRTRGYLLHEEAP